MENKILIAPKEAKKLLKNENYLFVAIGKPSEYEKNHIENSVRIYREDYSENDFKICKKEKLNNLLSKLSAKTKTLVLYDYRAGYDSARFYWVLKCYGFLDVLIIDGGIDGWIFDKLEIEIGDIQKEIDFLEFKSLKEIDENFIAYISDIEKAIDEQNFILDVRDYKEFTGEDIKPGAEKGGRIKNSILVPFDDVVDKNNGNKLKNKEDLFEIYKNILSEKKLIIAYCQIGVRSAFTFFVIYEILNYHNIKNYDGSWQEYSKTNLPFEKGN